MSESEEKVSDEAGEKARRRSEEKWTEEVLAPALQKSAERHPEFATQSGLPVERLYTPADVQGLDYERDLGYPGSVPFTRGVQPTMYRGRLWTMRQYAGFGTASESNRRYKYLLEQGQTGLSVAFDLPTQMGLDSDHPLAEGEVGKVGVAINSIRDMEALLDGIPLEKVSTSMTINSTAGILLAFYVAVARKRGIDEKTLSGTVQNDVLKEYMARGTYIYPIAPSMRLVGDIITYCASHLPRWNPISISGYHIREAGSTAAQEVAFTLANGIAYAQEVVSRDTPIDSFAPRLAFFFNAHSDFFEEIAKFRAARRLWAQVMQERFSAKNPQSMMLRFHTQTAGSSLTAQQPENNVVRVALQALSAVLGGTQSLHTNSLDEALALPTERSARIALRTQQIIAYETGVASTIDPLAGSYYLESLTTNIEEKAKEYLSRIDKMGGTLAAIEEGFQQNEIQDAAFEWQSAVDSGEHVIVGVNRFGASEPPHEDLLKVDPALQASQVEQLQQIRAQRDQAVVESNLERLRNAAGGSDNLMQHIIESVESLATLGEISDALRAVFGKYKERKAL
ncbi:MAG: methylmalonyl-CoA mutase family protein [Chloroflexota bacterium]|nr:methylmalonyl-CoA mutase family protein [Chloroflexota bacterium]